MMSESHLTSHAKVTIVFAIICIVIFLTACLYYVDVSSDGIHIIYRVTSSYDAAGIADKAVAQHNASQCSRIRLSWYARLVGLGPGEDDLRNLCYYSYARAVKDPAVCAAITDISRVIRNGCYDDLSTVLNEPNLCTLIKYDSVGAGLCMARFNNAQNGANFCLRFKDIDEAAQRECYHWSTILQKNAH